MSTSGSVPLPGGPADESPEKLGLFVRDLARAAGELHLSRLENPGEIREKGPKDLVTEVDLLSEELLISRIQERYPEDHILSEEAGGEISPTGRTWFLDPVDGTANFARANPLFCACVSVAEGDKIIHAAVAAPRLGDIYHASLGSGAFRETASGESYPLRVGSAEKLEDSFVGADVSYRHGNDPAKNNILEVFKRCWQVRSIGSAGIRGAWLAAGYIDVSIGTRNTAWDYAPTALLVSEAGGCVTNLTGAPWTYDADGLIASNNDALQEEVLKIVAGE
ncbi:MAG: inositol monophosphatase [Actinomycetota bacterium]|nr:inositol monophosphatase [Actinomycetota bacterium]